MCSQCDKFSKQEFLRNVLKFKRHLAENELKIRKKTRHSELLFYKTLYLIIHDNCFNFDKSRIQFFLYNYYEQNKKKTEK